MSCRFNGTCVVLFLNVVVLGEWYWHGLHFFFHFIGLCTITIKPFSSFVFCQIFISPRQVPSHYHVVAALAGLPPPSPPPLAEGALTRWLAGRECRGRTGGAGGSDAFQGAESKASFCHTQILQGDTAVAGCQGKVFDSLAWSVAAATPGTRLMKEKNSKWFLVAFYGLDTCCSVAMQPRQLHR